MRPRYEFFCVTKYLTPKIRAVRAVYQTETNKKLYLIYFKTLDKKEIIKKYENNHKFVAKIIRKIFPQSLSIFLLL